MTRRLISGSFLAAAVALAACGSGASGGYRGSSGRAAPAQAGSVSVEQIDGIGNVLVDSNGKALYSPDEEAGGKVLCTGACTSFWTPLAAGDAAPTPAPGVAALAVIDRPDGTKQLTAGGKPLYTFSEDSPGKVNGDGFTDDFGGQHLTWHAVRSDGTTSSGTGAGGSTTVAGSNSGAGSSGSSGGDYPGYGP